MPRVIILADDGVTVVNVAISSDGNLPEPWESRQHIVTESSLAQVGDRVDANGDVVFRPDPVG